MSSDPVATNFLRETSRIIPVTLDEAIKMSTKVRKGFKSFPPSKDQPVPILLHIKIYEYHPKNDRVMIYIIQRI